MSIRIRDNLISRLERMARREQGFNDVELLMPQEAAEVLQVSLRTLRLWADEGKLVFIRTLGGHRRYLASSVWERFADAVNHPKDSQGRVKWSQSLGA